MLPIDPQDPTSLLGIAQNAALSEKREAGPGDVGPTTNQDRSPLLQLQMTPEEAKEWKGRIERARTRAKTRSPKWDILLKEYVPIVIASGSPEAVKTNKHFRNVHSKIGQLFYDSPDLILLPKGRSLDQFPDIDPMTGMPRLDPMTGMPRFLTPEDIVSVKQEVLNQRMGRDGLKVTRLMDELLFDTLAWVGLGASKLGYACTFKEIQQPVMGPDPNFIAPMPTGPLGLSPQMQPPMVPQVDPMTGQPQMQTVKVPIHEEVYWRRFSPKKLLFNDDLRSTRFDEDATWMGMEFFMSPKQAKRAFNLTDEQVSKACQDDLLFQHEDDRGAAGPALVRGVEVWPKASHFRDDQPHPQALDQIVFIDGIADDLPVVYRPSPDQKYDQRGKLTEDSVLGFPIRVLTIRDFADSPYPMSDAAFTNSGIKELNTYRRQSIQLRDAQIGKYLYDGGAFDPKDIDIIKNGAVGEWIEVQEGKISLGIDKIMGVTPQVKSTRDDYQGAALIDKDIDETLGISSVQAGTPENTVRSATEIASVSTAIAARNKKEQGRVVDFYLDGARMIDSLLMQYSTQDDYVHISGNDGAQKMMKWNNVLIGGRWMYDIAPDSQHHVDTAQDRVQTLTLYNLTAQDPLVNRGYLLRRLCRLFGMDPSKMVLSPDQMMLQPPHGGRGGQVNQHQADTSGKRPNEPGASDHRQQQNPGQVMPPPGKLM